MKPIRIQRKRTKGWKMPENTVYVGRPTKWGNPIRLNGDNIYINASHRRKILDPWVWHTLGDAEDVVYLYEKLWDGTVFTNFDLNYLADQIKKLDLSELNGKNLACFCPLDKPCHADILLELANK
jgi:hypothetical protein